MTIDTYVIRRGNEPGALKTTGWGSDGKFSANTAGEFDFVVADVNSLTILFTMLKCKLSTESVQFPGRGLRYLAYDKSGKNGEPCDGNPVVTHFVKRNENRNAYEVNLQNAEYNLRTSVRQAA